MPRVRRIVVRCMQLAMLFVSLHLSGTVHLVEQILVTANGGSWHGDPEHGIAPEDEDAHDGDRGCASCQCHCGHDCLGDARAPSAWRCVRSAVGCDVGSFSYDDRAPRAPALPSLYRPPRV